MITSELSSADDPGAGAAVSGETLAERRRRHMKERVLGKPRYDWESLEVKVLLYLDAAQSTDVVSLQAALSLDEWRARKVLERLLKRGVLQKPNRSTWVRANIAREPAPVVTQPAIPVEKPKREARARVQSWSMLLPAALDIAKREGHVSKVLLLKALHIGSSTSAKLVDELVRTGVVGAYDRVLKRHHVLAHAPLADMMHEVSGPELLQWIERLRVFLGDTPEHGRYVKKLVRFVELGVAVELVLKKQ